MEADTIKGRAVVSIESGAKLGYVEDLVFDTQALRLAGLCISAEGQEAVIPFEDVKSLGHDAITVPGDSAARWKTTETTISKLPRLGQIKKLKVVDEAGTLLGTVHGVQVAPEDGRITEFDTRKGGVLGIGGEKHAIPARVVRSVGDEVLVVPTPPATGETSEKS